MKLNEKVAEFKLIARDALRMNLISTRLSTIASLEFQLTKIDTNTKDADHQLEVVNYEISKLDSDHPDYTEMKEIKEARVKNLTEVLAEYAKQTEEYNKLITTEKEAITKIESGETKVSLEDLNDLVTKMIKQDALNQVATVS